MRRGFAFVAAIFAIAVVPQSAVAKASAHMPTGHSVPLVVNELLPGFMVPHGTLQIPRGIAKFITAVPASAKGMHGIGIDGEQYNDIAGAPVLPGRTTSLTVALDPGDYTVYDSYKGNRAAGYSVKIHVTHAQQKKVSFGQRCGPKHRAFGVSQLWVVDETCRAAGRVAKGLDDAWQAADFSFAPLTVRGYTCSIAPFSVVGMKYSCRLGEKRFTAAT